MYPCTRPPYLLGQQLADVFELREVGLVDARRQRRQLDGLVPPRDRDALRMLHLCVCVCVREREREFVYIYICIHVCIL